MAGGAAATDRARPGGLPRSRAWIAPLAVFLVAFALRAVAAVEVRAEPYHRFLVLDADTYHRIALAGDPREPFWQPPLYPWFLRSVYALAGGPAPGAVRAVQALLGALTAAGCVLLARRLGAGPRAALAAGLGAALCAPLVNADLELLPGSLAALLATSVVLLACGPRRPVLRGAAAGLALGIGGILLPTLAIPGLLLLGWLARARGARAAAAFALLAALPVLAVAARNARFEDGVVPVSYNGGVNLFLGNNPAYPRTVGIRPGLDWTALVQEPRCAGGARTRADESAYFVAKVRAFAAEQPLTFLRHAAWKAAGALSVFEIGRNRDEYAVRGESVALRLLLWPWGFPGVVLLPLAAVGASALVRRRREVPAAGPVLALAAGVLAASVVFFPTARYRVPALPALVALAAAGLPRARRTDLAAGGVVLALGLVPHGIPPIPAWETAYEIGASFQQDGRPRDAVPFYRAALAAAPDDADVHLALGTALANAGASGEARAHLERAIALRPDSGLPWQALGGWWRAAGNHREALDALRRSVELDPCNRRAAAELADLLLDGGDLAGARALLDDAARRYPRRDAEVEKARARLRGLEAAAPAAPAASAGR